MSSAPARKLVMGILNVTPDSFSDGGRYLERDLAVEHGMELIADGADVIDVGGESTRPGAAPVPEELEIGRVVPVVAALAPHARISIDTTKAAVARAAVGAGATLVNDVSASLEGVAAELGVGWVAMHRRGTPATMQSLTAYDDVVVEVAAHLTEAAERAEAAGVEEVWLDPGIGFAKTAEQNLELLARLEEITRIGPPVLVGTSRKAFLGALLGDSDRLGSARAQAAARTGTVVRVREVPEPGPVEPLDRLEGSITTVVWALAKGARMVRVHDVRPAVEAARVVDG